MAEICGTCTHYSPDPPDTSPGPARTMTGFGSCAELKRVQRSDSMRVSEWPWGCRFTPSHYDGPDKNPPNPYQQMIEGGHTIGIVKDGKLIATDREVYKDPKDDRPPLELT